MRRRLCYAGGAQVAFPVAGLVDRGRHMLVRFIRKKHIVQTLLHVVRRSQCVKNCGQFAARDAHDA